MDRVPVTTDMQERAEKRHPGEFVHNMKQTVYAGHNYLWYHVGENKSTLVVTDKPEKPHETH
jgi:hypothetical protein